MKKRKISIITFSLFGLILIFISCDKKPVNPDNKVNDSKLFIEAVYNVNVDIEVVYGINPDDNIMNVYYPQEDTLEARPLLVISGGGAYYPSNLDFLDPIAKRMASAGYVVAAIRYISDINKEMDPLTRNIYSVQDQRAAIRYFRKDAAENNNYNIDINNVFAGGFGTGAFIALQLAYVDDTDLTAGEKSYIESLGGFEGDRGNAGYSSEVNAVVSMAGAVYDLNWIDANELPVVCVHSEFDNEVPFMSGTNSNGTMQFGPKLITEKAKEVGITNLLISINSSNHDQPAFCNDCHDQVIEFLSQFIE